MAGFWRGEVHRSPAAAAAQRHLNFSSRLLGRQQHAQQRPGVPSAGGSRQQKGVRFTTQFFLKARGLRTSAILVGGKVVKADKCDP